VKRIDYLFESCEILEDIKFGNTKTAPLDTMVAVFASCKKLTSII
jgi:hypothetical protein